mmetsp:Transcript_27454/g.63471  ORF Transcript_27454/g.63471 Transcript_27454/m.63471 type:complete len:169 (+) Transcript_27454:75-581(+)
MAGRGVGIGVGGGVPGGSGGVPVGGLDRPTTPRAGMGGARGPRAHRLMVPPPGYKFIPKHEKVCGEMGCFECYDIYCERCESKDRRIIELEMRNNELVKHITLLQARLFPREPPGGPGGSSRQGPSGAGGDAFAYVQSPVMYDPSLGLSYQATTTFTPAPGSRTPAMP